MADTYPMNTDAEGNFLNPQPRKEGATFTKVKSQTDLGDEENPPAVGETLYVKRFANGTLGTTIYWNTSVTLRDGEELVKFTSCPTKLQSERDRLRQALENLTNLIRLRPYMGSREYDEAKQLLEEIKP